jgi:hypothetical protein
MNIGANYSICSAPEDHTCRELTRAVDAADHTNYFGETSEQIIEGDCKIVKKLIVATDKPTINKVDDQEEDSGDDNE